MVYQNTCLTLFDKPIIYKIFACQKVSWYFQIFLFPVCIIRMELGWTIWQSATTPFSGIIKVWLTTPKPVYNIHDSIGLKLLTRLRLRLSYLKEHKFNHNFKDCVNLLDSFSLEVETVSHFFRHCNYFTDLRKALFIGLH